MEFGFFNRRESGGGFRDNRDKDSRERGGGFDRGNDRERGYNRDRDHKPRGFGGGGDRFQPRGGDRDFGGDRDESVFSKRVRAGKRRTYFFDVRKTRGEDYFITITESTRREDGYGYKRHKLFLYKEDFNRFAATLAEVVNHVKTDLMPAYDYEEFDRRQAEWEAQNRETEGEDRDEMDEHHDDETSDSTNPEVRDETLTEDAEIKGKLRTKDDDDMSW